MQCGMLRNIGSPKFKSEKKISLDIIKTKENPMPRIARGETVLGSYHIINRGNMKMKVFNDALK